MDFPITPEFWWRTDILSSSIFLQGLDREILPCGQGRIGSVEINPSLLMMTDCTFFHNYQGSIDFNIVNIHPTAAMYLFVSTGNRNDIE